MSSLVALVPLRGGSKSIPDKNIKLMAGKPLCAWVLEAAHAADVFDRIIVSTDSALIAEVVKGLGIPVEVLDRPAELATDTASTEAVMIHAAESVPFDILATIQATSPLVQPDDFQRAIDKFRRERLDSLLTAVRTKRFLWSEGGVALNYDPMSRPRRQDFEGVMMENGAFYLTSREVLIKHRCRLGGRIGIHEMRPETGIEIDEPEDWVEVERLLLLKKKAHHTDLASIRLVVVDIDGTLTDGGMYYSERGEELKKFNTRDAKGLELVRQRGVEVAVMTTENSPIVTARARKLGIEHCFIGVADKKTLLERICADLDVSMQEVAFIGDDVNDAECLDMAGFSACPSDAVPRVRSRCSYVSSFPGGCGAVRDICELIIQAKDLK